MNKKKIKRVSERKAKSEVKKFFTGDCSGILDSLIRQRKPMRIGADSWFAMDKETLEQVLDAYQS